MIQKTVYTPLGSLVLSEADGALSRLSWHHEHHHNSTPVLDKAAEQLHAYLSRDIERFDVPLFFESGTNFQKKVWSVIAEIPFGETATYSELAREVRSSPRAVGMACGKNPLPFFIPCHRVVGTSGNLTGYSGGDGLLTKNTLLTLEKMPENSVSMFSLWAHLRANISQKPFYFMRHGETDYNKQRILQGGSINTPLNRSGQKQAQSAGTALGSKIDFGDVWHSDLLRTEQTAEIFLKQMPSRKRRINHTRHFNERSFGLFEGKYDADLPPLHHIYQCSPEGESWLKVLTRVASGIETVLNKSSGKPPLVVAHGAVARCLGELLGCWPTETNFNNCEVWYVIPAGENQPWKAKQIYTGA